MSVPKNHGPDPHADPLIEAVLRAARDETRADCPDAEVLALYAECALPGDERGAIEAHVVGCGRCQATVAAFVRAEPAAAAPPAASTAPAAWWTGWRWLMPLASATAVLAVAVWIGRGPADQAADSARARDSAPLPEAVRMPEAATVPEAARAPDGAAAAREARPPDAPAPAAERAEAARPESVPERRQEAAADGRALPATAPEAVRPAAKVTAAPTAAEAAAPLADAVAQNRAAPTAGAGNALGVVAATSRAALTGTVSYAAQVPLPAGAVIEVRLLDVSRADAPADTLARAEIVTRGEQVPVPFTLNYDADALQSGRRYVVQATIVIDGRVAWRTTTAHPVFAAGASTTAPVTVTVDAVR